MFAEPIMSAKFVILDAQFAKTKVAHDNLNLVRRAFSLMDNLFAEHDRREQ